MTKHAVAKSGEIPVGSSKPVSVGDTNILVFHLSDGYYATQSSCTHLFMPLKKGKILDDCKIQCPFHRARFDIRTGEVCDWASFPPGIQLLNAVRKEKALQTYPVTEENGEVFVTL
ncbi:MAG TPA: Rieske 2Fe-2S domain-containing protein [Pseudomonadales bacterium]|nr:Rieske 2Fe-2S domain-containing protein [Pseudomonadales bacterium]